MTQAILNSAGCWGVCVPFKLNEPLPPTVGKQCKVSAKMAFPKKTEQPSPVTSTSPGRANFAHLKEQVLLSELVLLQIPPTATLLWKIPLELQQFVRRPVHTGFMDQVLVFLQ